MIFHYFPELDGLLEALDAVLAPQLKVADEAVAVEDELDALDVRLQPVEGLRHALTQVGVLHLVGQRGHILYPGSRKPDSSSGIAYVVCA